jgi:hypothetical protein
MKREERKEGRRRGRERGKEGGREGGREGGKQSILNVYLAGRERTAGATWPGEEDGKGKHEVTWGRRKK